MGVLLSDLSILAKLMPKSMLPPLDSSRELKCVLLGVGTQNYTCAKLVDTRAPSTTSAVSKWSISRSSQQH